MSGNCSSSSRLLPAGVFLCDWISRWVVAHNQVVHACALRWEQEASMQAFTWQPHVSLSANPPGCCRRVLCGCCPEHSCHGPPTPPHLHCRVPAKAAAEDCSKVQQLQLEHIQAVAAARLEGQQALADAQLAWAEQQAAAEKQHLQALLRCKQAQEKDRLQWQRERDELVQQLTAQYTASGLQVRGPPGCPAADCLLLLLQRVLPSVT